MSQKINIQRPYKYRKIISSDSAGTVFERVFSSSNILILQPLSTYSIYESAQLKIAFYVRKSFVFLDRLLFVDNNLNQNF